MSEVTEEKFFPVVLAHLLARAHVNMWTVLSARGTCRVPGSEVCPSTARAPRAQSLWPLSQAQPGCLNNSTVQQQRIGQTPSSARRPLYMASKEPAKLA